MAAAAIGFLAGLPTSKTAPCRCAAPLCAPRSIGAPESTLELEVSFGSLAELEGFWSAIPPQEHRAWGERMQQHIVHGSPQWQVHRCLSAFPQPDPGATTAAPAAVRGAPGSRAAVPGSSGSRGGHGSGGGGSGLLQVPSEEDVGRYAEPAGEPLPATQQQTASGLSVVSGEEEAQVVLDWKGDPMRISPGDKLPFKFL